MDIEIRSDCNGIMIELLDKGFKMAMNDITEDDFDIYLINRVFWWDDISDYIITMIDYLHQNGYETKTFRLDGKTIRIHPKYNKQNFLTGQIYIQVKRRS